MCVAHVFLGLLAINVPVKCVFFWGGWEVKDQHSGSVGRPTRSPGHRFLQDFDEKLADAAAQVQEVGRGSLARAHVDL